MTTRVLFLKLVLREKKNSSLHIVCGVFFFTFFFYYILLHRKIIKPSFNKYSVSDEPICSAGIEMQTQRIDLWAQWGKERVG